MLKFLVLFCKNYKSSNENLNNVDLDIQEKNSRKRQIRDISCTENERLTSMSNEENYETIEPTDKKIVLDQRELIVGDCNEQEEIRVEKQQLEQIKNLYEKKNIDCNAVKTFEDRSCQTQNHTKDVATQCEENLHGLASSSVTKTKKYRNRKTQTETGDTSIEQETTEFVTIEIEGENYEIICHRLKKISKDELLTNLDSLCSKPLFNARRLRLYEEIKLLVSEYLNEIIILVENLDMYKKISVIQFVLFWINYYRYKKDVINSKKLSKTIEVFNSGVLKDPQCNICIFCVIKNIKCDIKLNMYDYFILETYVSIWDIRISVEKMKKGILISRIFQTYEGIKCFLSQMYKDNFKFENVCISYDSRNEKNLQSNRKKVKYVYDYMIKKIIKSNKYNIVYFYCAIFEEESRYTEENIYIPPIKESLLIKETFHFDEVKNWPTKYFYMQVLVKNNGK